MAGRGRGIASFTFNIEALGIGRGSMPDARVGPSPLFPVSSEHTSFAQLNVILRHADTREPLNSNYGDEVLGNEQ